MLRARLRLVAPPLLFVVVAVALTWLTAALLAGALAAPATEPTAMRLLRASLVYAAIVGWQPLVAFVIVRRYFDHQRPLDWGTRPAASRFTVLSIAIAIAVLLAAATVDAWLSRASVQHAPARVDVSWTNAIGSLAAFSGVIAVLWLQAIAEELAWRGYLLARLMRSLGPWPGLISHGALWGLCYAPVFIVAGGLEAVDRVATFVVTCSLLGVVLGWLRLASGSIYASAASNATLTICAGLPLVLQGASPYFVAVFEPIGWLPLLVAIALFASRASWRSTIVVPSRRMPDHVN